MTRFLSFLGMIREYNVHIFEHYYQMQAHEIISVPVWFMASDLYTKIKKRYAKEWDIPEDRVGIHFKAVKGWHS